MGFTKMGRQSNRQKYKKGNPQREKNKQSQAGVKKQKTRDQTQCIQRADGRRAEEARAGSRNMGQIHKKQERDYGGHKGLQRTKQ